MQSIPRKTVRSTKKQEQQPRPEQLNQPDIKIPIAINANGGVKCPHCETLVPKKSGTRVCDSCGKKYIIK